MDSRKRMEYGFLGYQAPPLPRAMRSARGRGSGYRKKDGYDNGMVSIELLATVAGDLLQEQENQKSASEQLGVKSFEICHEVAGNGPREEENCAEEALLELEKSHIYTFEDAVQRQASSSQGTKVEPDDQGSSDENAVVLGASHRKVTLDASCIKESPDMIIQSASRSVSSISKSGCPVQSYNHNQKGLDIHVNTQARDEKAMQGISLGESGEKKGCVIEKEVYSTNTCKERFLTEQRLLGSGHNILDSGVGVTKETLGIVENNEGKGENEIDECNLGRWKRGHHVCENMEDDLMLDAHSLPASSGVSEEAPLDVDMKPPPLVSSGSSGDAHPCVGSKPDSYLSCPNTSIKVCRDDDDNSSGCTTPKRVIKKSFKAHYHRGAKLRRAITSKFRKAVTASSRKRKRSDIDIIANDDKMLKRETPCYGGSYTRQRTVRCSPSKRRRLAEEICIPTSDGHASTASAGLDSNGEDGEPPASAAKIRRAKSASVSSSPTSATGSSKHSSIKKSSESHVKLTIKSFTVPELFIDMPESATVASLKRTVMEAAMNLLGDGLRVCVLLQGKKVSDESYTLDQLGIAHGGKLDSVGFMLEPNPMPTSQACAEDPLFMLSRAVTQPSPRYPTGSASGQTTAAEGNKSVMKSRSNKINGTAGAEVAVTTGGRTQTETNQWTKSEYEVINDSPHMQAGSNPGALIVHPIVGAETAQGLALVPLNHKSRGSEIGKRRIRRPFSVAEVEALVHAVEKLGTGRWRDVKLRAFEQAKHRTYVDLKDKWKTLVHTAKIAPHQRRGEPVPQELLDRVIHAHNYWTDQQAKQQAEVCL